MTTLEKLFVQIFDRKNRIIEQVDQQSDLYTRHLVSKLLIDGITPPSWLWNPKFDSQSSDPKELNKEELISELLLPHPQPAVPYSGAHYPLFNKPLVIGDNGESSEGLFTGTHAPNRGFNTGDRPTTVSECHDNDIECALDCVPELDLSVTSPQWQIDASISNICTAPDESLARIQRSKSRQKALELRKSAKATPKSRFADENDIGASSSAIKISRIASQQLDCDNAVRQAKVECLSKEKDANIYCGRITRSRSSCNLSSRDSKPLKLLSSSDIAKEDGARKTMSKSACIEGVSKPVHSSNTASQRVTRSKSGASKKSLLVNSLNMLEGLLIQNVSGGDIIPHCPDTDAIANQEGKADYVTEPDRILDGPVDARAACSESNLDAAGLSVGLEVVLSRPPSDCSMSVKPKTLDFDDVEKCSLNETFNPIVEKERLDKSSGKRCAVVKSATSLDKVSFDDPCRKSLETQSLEQEVSNKREQPRRVSFDTCVEECVVVDEEVSELDINKNLQNAEDNSDAVVEIQHFPFSHEADVALLNVDKGLGVEMHQKVTCHLVEGFESSPRLQVEEGELGCDGRDTNNTTPFVFKHQQLGQSLVSNLTKHSAGVQGCLVGEVGMTDPSSAVLDVRQCYEEDNQDLMCIENKLDEGNMSGGLAWSERTLLERKSLVVEDGLLACGSVGSLHSEEKNFSSSEIRELQLLESSLHLGRRLRSVSEDSWPQFKRRKIDGQRTNFFSASPSFRVKEIHGMGGHTTNKNVKSMEDNLETVLQIECLPVSHEGDAAQLNSDKSPDMELNQKVNYHLSEGIEPSPELQLEQDESTSKHGQIGPSLVSSLTKEAAGDSHGCFMKNVGPADTTSIVLDVRKQCDEQNFKDLQHSEYNGTMENKDDLIHTERILQQKKSHFEEDGLFSCCSVESPQDKHMASVGADQTMPEFEGFIIHPEENEQPHIVRDAISFDKLDLPSTTVKRASVLEQLCKSASRHTPLSEFSATFKLHGTPDLYQSVPNGLLEHMDLRSTLNLNDDGGKQLRASYSCVDEVKCAFEGVLYSDCVPYTDARFGWSFKKPYMSPIGKLWDRISSNSSSSEKQRSLNPELTCFPIEEDPSISGENENIDEVADTIQEDISSTLMTRAKRQPLAEIKEACVNPPTSVSAAERFPDRNSLDSTNTEVSATGAQSRIKQKLGNRYRNKRRCTNEAKENRSLSVSTNCIKKATESLNNRFSKPKLSGKASLRKGGQNLLERESKRNNIVSNITSFLPLVQQKQAAAVGTGKRDIKVKALEAAEAAKRLEEKRQNERKMKKDALKLERERKELENLRQMEINKKKKEEEQKKKGADMAARKRLREEEERKEKERKRKRIEEPRQQQRGKEEKLRAEKEKEVPFGAMDENVNDGKESNNELRKHQKIKKPQTDPRAAEISTSNASQVILEDCQAFSHFGDNGEPTSVFTKTAEKDSFMAKTSPEKSYSISPYQCSDDEEDEEDERDEIHTKKFVPSWASKNSVALVLSSQQKVDPYIIFPPESFCSIDEVPTDSKITAKIGCNVEEIVVFKNIAAITWMRFLHQDKAKFNGEGDLAWAYLL
ncbi:unnamed protein product [Camellia sinensis]